MTTRVILYLTVLVNYFNLYETGVISDLYCKDPDSEKFYPIDTTWTSLNFCQNYTCKLRKRNIGSINPKLDNGLNNTNTDKMLGSSSKIVEQFIKPDINMTENKDKWTNNDDDQDRYLTEEEIKSITKLLHTIKKSELQSVIDIYKIAQDIYKDMENANSHKVVNYMNYEQPKTAQEYNYNYGANANWLNGYNMYDRAKSVQSDYISNVVPKIITPQVPKSNPTQQQYYGTRNTAYYYPMSSYERPSNYNYNPYPQQRPNAPTPNNQVSIPCPTSQSAYQSAMMSLAPWLNRIVKKPLSVQNPQYVYSTSTQCPYSYVYRYNSTNPSDTYYDKNYWSLYPNYVRSNTEPETQILTNKNDIVEEDNPKETSSDNVKDVNSNTKDTETSTLAEWQTEQLTPEVLEEVKANWDKPIFTNTILDGLFEKSNIAIPNPLKKPVKLEKVGTLLRLDDDVAREKRNVKDTAEFIDKTGEVESYTFEHEFEAYIEIQKCEPPTELGYFRVGNRTRPFPECCPQKIGNASNNVELN